MLLHNALNAIETSLEEIHFRTIAQTDKVMARGIEKVAAFGRIEVEEDARH